MLRLCSGSAWANLLGLTVLGLTVLVGGIYPFANGTIIRGEFIPLAWRKPTVELIVSMVQVALLLAVGLWLTGMGVRWVQAVRNPNAYFFLITPDHFTQGKGARERRRVGRGVNTQGGGAFGFTLWHGFAAGRRLPTTSAKHTARSATSTAIW